MTPEQIIDLYDANLNMTLTELAQVTGWAVSELKTLLMGGAV